VWLADVLGTLGRVILDSFTVAARNLSSYTVAGVKNLADGIKAASEALGDLVDVLPKLLAFITGANWAAWDRIAREGVTGGVVNAARVLTEVGAALLRAMVPAAATWGNSLLIASVKAFADGVGAVTSVLSDLMGVLPDLLAFISGSRWAVWDRIARDGTEGGVVNAARVLTEIGAAMMTQMRGAAAAWSGGGLTQAMQDLKDSVGAAVETLAGLMDVLPKLLAFISGKNWATWNRIAEEGTNGALVNAARVLAEIGVAMMREMQSAAAAWSDTGLVASIQGLRDSVGAAAETLAGLMDVLPKLLAFVSGKNWATWQRLASEGPNGTVTFAARTLADLGVAILTQMQAALAAWDGPEISETLRSLADSVSGALDLLTGTVDLVQKLVDLSKKGFPTIDPVAVAEMVINPIVTMGKALADRISAAVGEWEPTETATAALQSTLGDGLAVLRSTLEFVQELIDLSKSGFPTVDPASAAGLVIDPVVAMGKALASRIIAAVGAWQATETNAGNLSSTLSDGLSVIGNTIDFVQQIIDLSKKGFPTIDAEGAALLVINPIVNMAKALAAKIVAAVGAWQEVDTGAGALSSTLGDALSLIDNTLSFVQRLIDLGKEGFPTIDAEGAALLVINPIVAMAKALARAANAAVGVVVIETNPALTALNDILGTVGGLVDGVLGLFRSYMEAVKDEVGYSDAQVQAAVTTMVGVLIRYAKTLAEAARAAMGYAQVQTIPTLDKLGDAVGQIGSVVDGVLSIFRAYFDALDDKIPYSDAQVQAAVTAMVGVLVTYAKTLRAAASTAMAGIQVEAIPTLDTLGDVLGQLSSVTDSVLDIFRAYMAAIDDKVQYSSIEVQANVKGMVGVVVAKGDKFIFSRQCNTPAFDHNFGEHFWGNAVLTLGVNEGIDPFEIALPTE
jgi:uncharacterized protein YejL (UPF0352 family)